MDIVKEKENVVSAKNIQINKDTMEIIVGGRYIFITPTEYKILLLFFNNLNKVISYEVFSQQVWGWEQTNKAIVNTNINRLRKKIGAEKIDTIRGFGYIMRDK